jgi:hypothetical protein
MADVSQALTLPVYTTAPAPISLLTEPATTMNGPPYMPSYSPPLPEQSQGSMYPSAYGQQLPPAYSMQMDYPPSYPGSQYR